MQLMEKTRGISRPVIPQAFEFLYATHTPAGIPVRYKVAKGGRGKGATWSIGRRLIDKAHSQRSLILCTREIQQSIMDSVHRLLKSQIIISGYQEFFRITDHRITHLVTGSEFIFRGLNDLTVESIRSMEGVTDVWCAEAEMMGQRSWDVLDPTIREGGSEIYVDYNPDREDSPTNKMFTVDCPDNAIVRHINYDQNPYFPAELEKQRQQALAKIENAPNEDARDLAQENYNHIWLGSCRKVNKASILGSSYIVEAFDPLKDEGSWDGPYDGADWGFSQDPTVRIRCWVHTKLNGRRRLCIEREAYGVGVELNDLPAMFDVFPDSRKTRIRGDNARPETISHMKNAGFNIIAADKWKGSVEDGVEHMRGAYDVIVVHPRCIETEKEMRLYSYKVDRLTKEILTDIMDAWNHCLTADTLVETDNGPIPIIKLVGKTGMVKTLHGLKRFHGVRQTSANEVVYRIETDFGNIDCTADHLILTDQGWIPALALSSEYRIVSINNATRYGNDKCQNMSNMKENGFTSAKMVTTFARCQSIFIARSGANIMVSNLKGRISTISTIIQKIMTSEIYSLCQQKNTKSIIEKILQRTGSNSLETTSSQMLVLRHRYGINQKQGKNGIRSITKSVDSFSGLRMKSHALVAAIRLLFQKDERLVIARKLAKLVTGANRKWIIFRGNVPIVTNNSALINTAIPHAAPSAVPCFYVGIKKITKLSRQPVYNMEVEDVHHFAINGGLIVHNCIDAIRYALDPLITRKKGSHLFGKGSGKPQ